MTVAARGSEDRTAGHAPSRPALSRVVDPEALGRFASEVWSREPLLTPAARLPSGFTDLLDMAAIDELVSRRGLRTPFVRMAKDGSVVPSGRYTGPGGTGAEIADQVVDDDVLGLLGGGATLVLQALHRTWPPVVDFAARLSAELGHPVQVNAYVTPPQNQGFAAHYDTHDVFVLQVAGRKRWRVHRPVVTAPLPGQASDAHSAAVTERAATPPLVDAVLEPGDALYLPRGYVHAASAQGETSVHLTVGVHPVTRHSLARHLLEAATDVAELRASLPVGVDLTDPDVLAPHVQAVVGGLRRHLETVRPDEVARAVAAALARSTRPEPVAPLAQLSAADGLEHSTRVRVRVGLRCRVDADTEADAVHLRLRDRTVSLPGRAAPALRLLLAGDALAPADLPGIDPDEQLVVVRRLLREGVLLPA